MAYIGVADLKSYLGITTSSEDALMTTLIAAAQAAIDTYTGRTFEASADTTKYFDAMAPYVNGYELSWADLGLDLCQITTVTNGDSVVVTSSQYVTMPRNTTPYYGIRIKQSSNVSWTYSTDWESAISIVGRWAYSTSADATIQQACKRWAAYMYRQKDAGTFETVAIPNAGVIEVPQGIPKDVTMLLKPYVRRV